MALALLAAGALAACDRRPAAPILTWHQISPAAAGSGPPVPPPHRWSVPEPLFLAQLDALVGAGFTAVPLRALFERREAGPPLPPRALVLTFDDGTEDHLTRALPALRARRLVATFFVVPARIAGDAVARVVEHTGEGELRYLTWPEVRALREAGMEIGSHGLTHARLSELDDDAALQELVRSRALLGAQLGAPPDFLAWPYNALRPQQRALAREAGYRGAVAGEVHGGADPYSLYRISVTAATEPGALLRALSR